MKYGLIDFQKDAVTELLKKMESMRRSYDADGSLSAVSLTAPTGAGKTVISAAVAEGLFYGNDTYAGDDRAAILWLSDSPSLNEQTMKRFDAATDLLNGAVSMEAISADFAKNHAKLSPGHIYFLNRQLLGKGKKLTNEAEGGRSFYDVLNATIEDDDIHLFLFIDEAHRGLGTGNDKGTSDNANKTIYSIIIDGQDGINKPMPCVVGISATPERFNNAMAGRKNRDMKASVDVPVSAVKDSGLIKDMIELRTPKKAADTKHQDSEVLGSVRKRPVTGPLEIVVPDNVTSVPHYRPSKNVKVRESYSDVDEQDNIDDLVLDKSEDKSSDILAMRLQQKAERDRKHKKANSGVVEIRKDMKSVHGLSTESVMERIRGVQDEKEDRSL